jgi:hypothetical protein
MTTRYVELSATEFESFLQSKGFTRTIQKEEIVYVMQHKKHPDLYIKVYTSLGINNAARECGADAIRVCAVISKGDYSRGLYKGARVYRTGSQDKVQARTLERMREAYAKCNDWIKSQYGNK